MTGSWYVYIAWLCSLVKMATVVAHYAGWLHVEQ